ncbi:hypothetical protein BVRB_7g164910 [Beta vulgaris subsp. vulgaris]|uniref:Uncharacterized protein n=1 Tax=Beta vulgaris subsp. vulgaris TaxID=3555 RepID=A0A0J8BWH0_BETVV|nr:hypothetical protein BVRB_7g164910 [Beta vulgaris subsp. vulgaris]
MAKGIKRDMVLQENATSDSSMMTMVIGMNVRTAEVTQLCATVGKAIQEGRKIPLLWNRIKVPCEDHRTTFYTYVGVLIHEHVDINYLRWGDVPKELKNSLYESITLSLDLVFENDAKLAESELIPIMV